MNLRSARVVLVAVVVAGGCSKSKPRPVIEPAPDPPPSPSAVEATPAAQAATTTSSPLATPAPAAAKTRFVSHMVNGHVEIEEVPVEDAPLPTLAELRAQTAATTAAATTAAATATTTHAQEPALAPEAIGDSAESQRAFVAAQQEPDLGKRIEKLEALAPKVAQKASRAFVYMALGDAYDKQNDALRAIDAYEKANELAPSSTLAHRLDVLKTRHGTERDFDHITREHFVARFQGDADKSLADTSLAHLDEAWRSIGDALDLHPSSPITVLFYTGQQYKDVIHAPDWSGGLYDGKIRIPESSRRITSGDLRGVLFHEYTHALLHESVQGVVPGWFHEGLAQHLEPTVDRRGIAEVHALGFDKVPKPKQMGAGFGGLTAARAHVAYPCALDIVDMLAEWRGERSFVDLFAEMNKGKSFDDAVDAVYALTPELLESKWKQRFP